MSLDFLRGIGNNSVELVRLGGAIALPVFLVFIGVHLWRDREFNAVEAGTGIGLVIAATAGGAAVKDTAAAKAASLQAAADAGAT